MEQDNKIPNTLDEAVALLMRYTEGEHEYIKSISEDKFIGEAHHGFSMGIRNEWFLWWYPNHGYPNHGHNGWPVERPKLVEYFNSIDIYHADDMSTILMSCVYKKLNDQPYDIEYYVKKFKAHWAKEGFVNGIFNHNRNA